MDVAQVKWLESSVSSQILASSGIASYHQAVEELILNSIDAQSTIITLDLDIEKFRIKVIDNGTGISESDLQEKVGEWHCSSKDLNEQSYGCKGRALATLKHLAENVEIISWTKNAPRPSHKRLSDDHSRNFPLLSSVEPRWQGTIVEVTGLFTGLAVRQKSLQTSTERYQLVEFVKKMSILHHHITWKVNDQDQVILQLTGCLSVSKRLISLHGVSILSNLTKVSHREGNLTIQGLLSPPSAEACHWTRDIQYSYLNHRYCRNADLISTLVNNIYTKRLQTDTHGPRRKHAAQSKIYPIFVLHCVCPPSEYDILAEPDKTRVFFRDEQKVKSLIVGMMKTLFQIDVSATVFPNMTYDATADIGGGESPLIPVRTSASLALKPAMPLPSTSPYRVIPSQSILPEASSDMHSLFEEGFSGFDDVRQVGTPVRSVLPVHPASLPNRSTDKMFASNAISQALLSEERVGVRISRVPMPICDLFTEGLESHVDELAAAAFELLDTRRIDVYDKSHSDLSLEAELFEDHSFESVEPQRLSFFDQFRFVGNPAPENPIRSIESTRVLPSKLEDGLPATSSAYFNSASEDDAEAGKRVNPVRSSHATTLTKTIDSSNAFSHSVPSYPLPGQYKSLQLNREQLGDIQFVAQWDEKFLLGYDKVNKLLVAFDQHAVHERILFEKFSKELQVKCRQLVKPMHVLITSEEHVCFSQKQALFEQYGFSYVIQSSDSRQKRKRKRKKDIIDDDCGHVPYLLDVTAVGSVLDEEFTIPDMMDFCHELMKSSVPDHMIKPSAIVRIVASKACHSAIKFNTALSKDFAEEMLATLSSTDLPFQCAHGRPSVVPLADLSEYNDMHSL